MFALPAALRSGYSPSDLRADVFAGLTVGILALPLAMALAIASGVPPQHGLFTSIVAGALCALAGGSRLSVSGPTAAFVALLAPISAQYGIGGLACASVMAGLLLLAMGVAKLGRLVQFIPYPVTTGFTAGIAVVIAMLQVRDFVGAPATGPSENLADRIMAVAHAIPAANPGDVAVGVFALAFLIVWPRFVSKVPAPLVAVPAAAVLAVLIHRYAGLDAATIGSRFQYVTGDGAIARGIPTGLPAFKFPWLLPGGDGAPLGMDLDLLRQLVGPAFAIAMLGAIESLLCAVVSDGMAGTRHDPDAELIGQGLGNAVAPFFGGMAATGAIARTATNVRAGARSPIAAMVHAGLVLLAMLVLGRALSYVPMAALAALLLVAAWNMADVRHAIHVLRIAPRGDKLVFVSCFGLTVVFDMVVAVGVGIVFAALLFMRRMAEITSSRLVGAAEGERSESLPKGILLYEISGPLFFGAAQKAMRTLERIASPPRAVVLSLQAVPVMDVTGLVGLESAIRELQKTGTKVWIGGLAPQPRRLVRDGLADVNLNVPLFARLEDALDAARRDLPAPEASLQAQTSAL